MVGLDLAGHNVDPGGHNGHAPAIEIKREVFWRERGAHKGIAFFGLSKQALFCLYTIFR